MDFVVARLESSRASSYDRKTEKNNIKRKFVDEYIGAKNQITDKLRDITRTYILLEKGIVPETYNGELNIEEKDIHNIFEKIKKQASDNFILFYKSYLRKIKLGYKSDYIESSFNDLKTAYYTLRKCKNYNWDCPDERISKKEMENLFLLITENNISTRHEGEISK